MEIRIELHGETVSGVEVTDAELDLACIESLLDLVARLGDAVPNSETPQLRAAAVHEAAIRGGRGG